MEAYITRKQIRGINKKLLAYDLIYKGADNANTVSYLITNVIINDDATEDVSGVPMVIELGADSIKENLDNIRLLDKDAVIIQINNETLNKSDCVQDIIALKNEGYSFITFVNGNDKNLMKAKIISNYIKVDINDIPLALISDRKSLRCELIVDNVNTREDYVKAESLDTNYYEGSYIAMEATVDLEDSQHSKVNFIEVMSLISKEEPDMKQIADVIKRDALLSSQIVRLSNSAYFAGRSRNDDVGKAVIRIGINNLKRWIFLIEFKNNDNVPEELLKCSYMRALFAEKLVNKNTKIGVKPACAYMIGLFSTINILTGKPMEHAVTSMQLDEEVEEALIYREGKGGTLLNLITSYEEANWTRVDKYVTDLSLNKDELYKIYFDAIDEVGKFWGNLDSADGGL